MAKLPAGKASVPIKAGQDVEVERTDADGIKWLCPLTVGIAVSDSVSVPGTKVQQVTVQLHGDFTTRCVGTAQHDADTGEWVFAW